MPATTADRIRECQSVFEKLVDTLLPDDLLTADPKERGHIAFDLLNGLWDSAYEAGRQDAAR